MKLRASAPVNPLPVPRMLFSFSLLALFGLMLSAAAQAQTASFSYAITALGGGFNYPWGAAVDGSGNIYVTDYDNSAVYEMPAGCASSSCMTTLGGGFSGPTGLAVDGSGNVYVADFSNSAVKKMPAGCASSSCVATLGGGFDDPAGVAVDSSGNVYVADTYSSKVKKMSASCTSSSCVTTLGGGFSLPYDVAVDGSGKIYVADYNNSAVKEMAATCATSSCVNTLGGGFNHPIGVAVDSSDNVYVADYSNSAVKKMPAGCASSSCVTTLGSGFSAPIGMAVDGNRNVYLTDTGNKVVKEIMTRGVNFFSVPVGTASAALALTFTFESGGSLSSTTPYKALTEGAKNLDFNAAASQGSNVCKGTTTYTTGETCTVNVTFTPAYAGMRYGAVELLNAGGSSIATAHVYGTGQGPQVVFSPATQSTLGGGFGDTFGVAVDGSGNVYVADYSNSAVYEMPAGCATSSCVTTLGGGFINPAGVAVDGSGNVYVANSDDGLVNEMPPGCASSGCVTTLGGGFHEAFGVAVDGSGTVYVADTYNNAVKEMPAGCASASCVTALGGGFSGPSAVTVDASGNVYVADTFNNAVKEMPAGCASSSCVTTLGGGFSDPFDVAVDASGNIYVADDGNEAVKEMPAGCTSSSCVTTLLANLGGPQSVALDGSGNVYVSDSRNDAVREIYRTTPPSLSFAATLVGSTSSDSPQTVAVENIGNLPLTFSIPTSGTNPSYPANFPENTGDANLCASGTPLVQGTSCYVSVSFMPTAQGANTGSVVLTDNNLNQTKATQSIALSGTGDTAPAVLISPAPSSTLTSSGVTFQWSTGSGVTQYVLGIGSTGVGSYNLFNSTPITAIQASVTGLPTNGTTLYVRLYSMINGAWQYNDYIYTAAPTPVPAVLTSPTPGSVLTSSSATFQWTAGTGATQYVLGIGSTGVGSYNLFNSTPITATQASVTGLPTNGETLYARIYSWINGAWQFNDYTYTAGATPAVLTSPNPGTALTSSSATFQWTAGTGVTQYVLGIGSTGVGSYDLFNSTPITAIQASVTGLPTNGETLYARLYSLINGAWQYHDYTYTAAATPAVLTSPTPGSALTSSSATFQWTAGSGVTQYVLGIGSMGVGSYDLFNSTPITATQASVTGLPTNGETLYARLYSLINGAWQYHDYTYTAAATPAVLTNPTPGSTLTSSSATFQWTTGTGVTQYVLGIGSTGVGSYDLFNSTPITATQASVTGLPTNGETLYARLYSLINGAWQYHDYTYTAAATPAVLTSPTPGSTLTSSSATFQWTAGSGVTQYVLGIGSTGVGSYNLYNSTPITATQASVTGLPTNGETLYVRIYSLINGAWQFHDYTYTAQ